MRIGLTFPQTEIGSDPAVVRDYAQTAEELGFTHLLTYDHVVGADTTTRPDWDGPYTIRDLFHEPLVLFGYLAALTRRIEFVTGILILPQRQTVLVAKQAAEVDVLSGGRFRLGIGIGWNTVEYQALNQDFSNRGTRSEEQIQVLRALFTHESVTFHGRWHTIEAAGLNPMPVQRPIPVWLGGRSEATLRRVARMADGWFPLISPEKAAPMIEQIRALAAEAGPDPNSIGIEARISIANSTPDDWRAALEAWKAAGATHIDFNTMRAGFTSPREHIAALSRIREAFDGADTDA